METRFLKDALFGGMTSNAFKLGTVLSMGWFWQRLSGCHTVYRGQDGDLDYDSVVAVMELSDSQISITNQALPANTIWHYTRRQVSDCGLESPDADVCVVVIDSNGDMVGDTPNPPVSLAIEQLVGGKLKLRWRYTQLSEEIAPTGFNIYMDSGSGFDLGSPTSVVSFGLGGMGGFSWTSSALTHGQVYRFIVRSYRDAAGESNNTNYVAAKADNLGPDAIEGLRVSWEDI